jgi:hypothetical protein
MEPTYLDMLMQWLFLFGLLSVILLPAFIFKNIARANGKSQVMFCFVGVAVGLIINQLCRLSISGLSTFEWSTKYQQHLWIIYLVLSYVFVFLSVAIFRRMMVTGNK